MAEIDFHNNTWIMEYNETKGTNAQMMKGIKEVKRRKEMKRQSQRYIDL